MSTRQRFRVCGALLLILFLTAGNISAAAETREITLVENGEGTAVIVTAGEVGPAGRLAALELQYHIEKITGVVLPISTDIEEVKGNRILVGESKATRQLGLKGADFKQRSI